MCHLLGGVGGSDVALLDVGVGNREAEELGPDVIGNARGGSAGPALYSWDGEILVEGVAGIEPQNVGGVVVPDGECKNHFSAEGIAHSLHSTFGFKVIADAKGGLLLYTEVAANGVGLVIPETLVPEF